MPSFFDLPIENKTGGLMADPMTAYLENPEKRLDQTVLHEMEAMFRKSVVRQLMQPRDLRKGKESNTLYSFPCARKARYIFDGAKRAPVPARATLKFLLGDLVELAVLGVARLAGLDIGLNNEDLVIQGHDGKLVPVHPDGLLNVGGKHYNLEVKSCDSRTFDRWLEQGGPSDDWGYRTQATVEVEAWKQGSWDVTATCFVAVSTGTRQGSIAEWIIPQEPALLDVWHERRRLRQQPELPPVPFLPVPEIEFVKGKALDADTLAAALFHGEPQPRKDKHDRIHGWDVPTGRQLVGTVCSYCDFLSLCHPRAQMEMVSGKPVWVIPPEPSPLFSGPSKMRELPMIHEQTLESGEVA